MSVYRRHVDDSSGYREVQILPLRERVLRPIDMEPITKFDGKYRFLSNFFPHVISFEGMDYPTIEHAYQASKTMFLQHKRDIQKAPSPGVAKRLGRKVPLRPNWESIKLRLMEELLREKFRPYSYLADLLSSTHPAHLLEENWWGDTFWGVHNGEGENHLGEILMKIRDDLVGNGRRR